MTTPSIPAIQAHNLTFSLSNGDILLNGINFISTPGLNALIGANGSGKSTLARLLCGQLTPDNGRVERYGHIVYLAQTEPADTAERRLVDGLGFGAKYDALRRIEQGKAVDADFDRLNEHWLLNEDMQTICAHLKLPFSPQRKLHQLSGGQQMRIRLWRALESAPDCLILDEPTNHLDIQGRRWLQQTLQDFIRRTSASVLVISHDIELLHQVDDIIELNQGHLRRYGGNYQTYREIKNAETQAARQQLQHAKDSQKQAEQQIQRRMEKAQRRQVNASRSRRKGGQAKIILDFGKERSQHTITRLTTLSGQQRAQSADAVQQARQRVVETSPVRFEFTQAVPDHNKPCLVATDLVLPYGDTAPRSFTLRGRDKVWLQGVNGSGKSTLLQVMTGQLSPAGGALQISTPVYWLNQYGLNQYGLNQHGLNQPFQLQNDNGNWNALDYLQARCPTLDITTARTHLAQTGLSSQQIKVPVSQLSGGEQVKLAMLSLARQPEAGLLLLDEPDNHLDLNAKQVLAQALADYPGAAILISHDPGFVEQAGFTQTLLLKGD